MPPFPPLFGRRLPDPGLAVSLASVFGELTPGCILMFSGGRDSTIAAARLNERGERVTLVTVTSDHLIGIERVHRRLRELARLLPPETPWIRVRQPEALKADTSFYDYTCLPCHHAYAVVAASVARIMRARRLAFGYAAYQNDWPEQTPLAVCRLSAVLAHHGIELILPVYDLSSRENALSELMARSLDPESLEQKCLQQIRNIALDANRLAQQVGLWEAAIETSMAASPPVEIEVLTLTTVGAV
jgi:hypothetical protein